MALRYRTEAKFAFVEDAAGHHQPKVIVHRDGEESKEMYDIDNRLMRVIVFALRVLSLPSLFRLQTQHCSEALLGDLRP